MVTMGQIAAELNLSRTTVSLALGGQWKEVGISPATRNQVITKAKELGYRRNVIATSLKSRVTKTIGIVVPTINGDSYDHMLHGIESSVGEEYTLLLGVSGYNGGKELKLLQSFEERMVDGLILVHSGDRENLPFMEHLLSHHVPVVQADRFYPELKTDIVEADNEALGIGLTEHFIQSGHRDIAYLRSPVVNSSTLGRARGYAQAMERHGLTPNLLPPRAVNLDQDRTDCGYSQSKGLLQSKKRPSAFVTHDLSICFGVLKAAREFGLKPTDLAISTVANASDNPIYEYLPSNVALAVWSLRDLGSHAGTLLRKRLQQPPANAPAFETVRIPYRMISDKHAIGWR